MGYNFLQNFSSLLEVFTAIYVSMFLDEIIKDFWTPDYKEKISQLIKGMKIPAINFFVVKVEKNIEENAQKIGKHMKRKAAFFFVFCLSFLLLAGLEAHSTILSEEGYLIVTILSLFAGVFIFIGRWMFSSLRLVVLSILIYVIVFIFLYFSPVAELLNKWDGVYLIDDKVATICFLGVMALPILWQITIVWLYSRCYRGFMQEKISKEAYIYGKAYIAYKIKDMAALPSEYEVVARDFVKAPSREEDISLKSLNEILVNRLEAICIPPKPYSILWSWIKYNWRGRHNPEAEYIQKHGFDYETMLVEEQPVQVSCSTKEDNKKSKQLYYTLGLIVGYLLFWYSKVRRKNREGREKVESKRMET